MTDTYYVNPDQFREYHEKLYSNFCPVCREPMTWLERIPPVPFCRKCDIILAKRQ